MLASALPTWFPECGLLEQEKSSKSGMEWFRGVVKAAGAGVKKIENGECQERHHQLEHEAHAQMDSVRCLLNNNLLNKPKSFSSSPTCPNPHTLASSPMTAHLPPLPKISTSCSTLILLPLVCLPTHIWIHMLTPLGFSQADLIIICP